MRPSFPTRDQLAAMSLKRLRSIDISDAEEEAIVQEFVNSRMQYEPTPDQPFRGDIPDITNGEQEKAAQEKIDKRTKKPKQVEVEPEPAEEAEVPVEPTPEVPVEPEAPLSASKEPKKKGCEYCGSTGAHKKDCVLKKSNAIS